VSLHVWGPACARDIGVEGSGSPRVVVVGSAPCAEITCHIGYG
jgi:hypothetical protein